ncbi:MAG: phosphoribosylglycinamide formyltransferase [Crocinitomicaceae bacterium]
MTKIKLALFASGTGSNVIRFIEYFKNHPSIEVSFVLTNKNDAPVIEKVKAISNIPVLIFNNNIVADGEKLKDICSVQNIDYIILAGYLRKIPESFTKAFPNKIINVHPSLLPKFGGKGMYGKYVHEAVLANQEVESGISIHFVNEEFDEGKIIAQHKCTLKTTEDLSSLQQKIQLLEHQFFPLEVEKVIQNNLK